MKKHVIWAIVGILLLIVVVLPSCKQTTSTKTSSTSSVITQASSTTSSPAKESHWWDVFGEPEYGGELIIREGELTGMSWDPSSPFGSFYTQMPAETMFQPNWTTDRKLWAFQYGFTPIEYMTGAQRNRGNRPTRRPGP